MIATRCGQACGASLIEVMLAVALTAVTALGLMATQLWIARETRAAALREQAAFLADAVAESSRAPGGDASAALRQWSARAESLLPQGEASTSERGDGVSFARVLWSAARSLPVPDPATAKSDVCGDLPVAAGLACIAVAFVK